MVFVRKNVSNYALNLFKQFHNLLYNFDLFFHNKNIQNTVSEHYLI